MIASIFILIIFNLYMIYLYIRTGLDDETLINFADKDFESIFFGGKKKENNKENEEKDETKQGGEVWILITTLISLSNSL